MAPLRLTINFTVSLNPALKQRDLSGKVDLSSLFPKKPTCVLAPELTIGPYCKTPIRISYIESLRSYGIYIAR